MPKKEAYHHGDLRRALIDAALALIAEKDVASLSLREVARQAGVSHAAPYRHFVDKEALLAAVAEEGFIEFAHYLTQAREQTSGDTLTKFIAVGVAYVRYALEHSTHYQVMFGSYCLFKPDFAGLLQAAANAYAVLSDLVQQGQAEGLIQAGDPKMIASVAWAQTHGLAMLVMNGQLVVPQGVALDQWSDILLQTLIKGLATPKAALVE
jgi:AcrR family transcriptional regulator